MDKYIEKAGILIEALPYIKEFYGKTVVVKYGGSAMTDESVSRSIIQDIVLMKLVGMKPVVVHGGGPAINRMLDKTGKKPEFSNGLRVTDKETVEIVEMVLSGRINKGIVDMFNAHRIKAAGISGKDGNLFTAVKMKSENVDLGFVGEISDVDTSIISVLVDNNYIPVVAPLASDPGGNTYNINADVAASVLASSIKAEKLLYLTDIPGILRNPEDENSLIHSISSSEAEKLISDKIITGGMIPKTEYALNAVKKGVHSVHILDGRRDHSLLLEVFTQKGIGTIIEKEII